MRIPSRRLLVLVAVGAVVVLGSLGYLHYFATFRFWLPQPVGDGPAGPSVPREPFAATWTNRHVVLLGIGDSVTSGFGARPGHSYFSLLTANPDDEFDALRGVTLGKVFPKFTAMNLAMSGSDSLRHASVELAFLKTFDSDTFGVVVMTTGGNDLIHWYGRTKPQECAMYGATFATAEPWIKRFRARLSGMLDRITASFPGGCAIYLATIYDPSDGIGDPAAAGLPPWPDMLRIHAAYNDIIRSVAKDRQNVHVVDVHGEFLGHGVHCVQWWRDHYRREDPHYWYYANLEDPNDRGYDAIRRLFLIEMVKTLPGALKEPVPNRKTE